MGGWFALFSLLFSYPHFHSHFLCHFLYLFVFSWPGWAEPTLLAHLGGTNSDDDEGMKMYLRPKTMSGAGVIMAGDGRR